MGLKAKKFGTFGGVFTPSILTILGVIMYLRFPVILGQAGLINTLGIIVVAHIISFSTSLSLASLSTDKQVKTGGTYFMISRSLGLPIGGTLGLSLFVGLALSVSLYLIGFAESFLIYWDLDGSIDSIRLTGTIILLIVTTITFISTSLAIKSQYFIMTAMVLSLLSIFFGHHEFTPEKINLQPIANAAPFMLLFGIFFPAVTGFEAGVAMSGDLKNPNKSLPLGALSAVTVGFVIYITLAFFFAYTVDSNALANDKDILFKIALVPELVIAGIWGATLSSALGSILGAPRILQAIAMDKIAPKFFAKGTGKTNQPRNALLLAFVIAEAGILIGELDVIARIVSMFFITTYAFLNLASAIESWSSSDFRPAFKTPRFISILGATAAFIVMILLDFVALMVAVVVLGLLFFFLKRRELTLEAGDAWSSFWANLAKHSLLSLSKEKMSLRNWRPNILLFRGGEQERVHLVDLGLALAGKLGILTDFELIIQSNSKNRTIPQISSNKTNGKDIRFFKRKFETGSLEEGLRTVTSVYGFSGFEPNTVMMGWSRNVQNADVLVSALNDFKSKNLNAIFLDYDKIHGFGNKSSIDIWWGGVGPHLNFSLELVKFLLTDRDWRDAHVRILVINSDKTITDRIYTGIRSVLDEKRMEAEIKIIANEFGSRSNEMIIIDESERTDLVLMGISEITIESAGQYVERINYLSNLHASLLILSPSKEFEPLDFITQSSQKVRENTVSRLSLRKSIPEIDHPILKERIEKLDESLREAEAAFIEKSFSAPAQLISEMILNLAAFTENNFRKTEKLSVGLSNDQLPKVLGRQHYELLNFYTDFFKRQPSTSLSEIKSLLTEGTAKLLDSIKEYIHGSPENILITYTNQRTGRKKKRIFRYRHMLEHAVDQKILPAFLNQLHAFHFKSEKLFADLKILIVRLNDLYEHAIRNNNPQKGLNPEIKSQIVADLNILSTRSDQLINEGNNVLIKIIRNQVIEISKTLLNPGNRLSGMFSKRIIKADALGEILEFPDLWESNMLLLNNSAYLDSHLTLESKMISGAIQKNNEKIFSMLQLKILRPLDDLLINLKNAGTGSKGKISEVVFSDGIDSTLIFQETFTKITELLERLPETLAIKRETKDVNQSDSIPYLFESQSTEPLKLALHYFASGFYDSYYHELETLDSITVKTISVCREVNSLLTFRLNNEVQDDKLLVDSDLSTFLNQLSKQLKQEETRITEAYKRISQKSVTMLENALAPLYSFAIVESGEKLATHQRLRNSQALGRGFAKNIAGIKQSINQFIIEILYSSSDGLILAKKILKKKSQTKTSIKQLLDIVEDEAPNKRILNQIPVFYRSLFSSKSMINKDLWVQMDEETEIIHKAVKRHNDGFGGAILITGVHGAGKTALTRYCIGKFFRKDRVFYIKPPVEGTTDLNIWQEELQKVTGNNESPSEILMTLPPKSVLVFNDLELWWERSEKGCEIIYELTQLIRTFSRDVLFIMNCNTYAFHQINKAFPIEDHILSLVECRPFDTRKLQQLILKRHNTSGLTFHYRNTSQNALLQLRIAALFHSYFNYSQGIPGVAINAWIKNITKVSLKDIFITRPESPNLEKLADLDKEWLIVIALFIQHKNLTSEKLSRIMDLTSDDSVKLMENLLNAGIIDVRANGIFKLNVYLEPFLVRICTEKGII
ncbi:MAG: amino acid permease [Lentimicrobium sp.]|nr:amino acid permease [Lentimicrobium sp.]